MSGWYHKWMPYKKQELLILRGNLASPPCFLGDESLVFALFVFVMCLVSSVSCFFELSVFHYSLDGCWLSLCFPLLLRRMLIVPLVSSNSSYRNMDDLWGQLGCPLWLTIYHMRWFVQWMVEFVGVYCHFQLLFIFILTTRLIVNSLYFISMSNYNLTAWSNIINPDNAGLLSFNCSRK